MFPSNWYVRFASYVSGRSVVLNNLKQDISFYSVFGKRDFTRGNGKRVFFTGENVHSKDNPKYNDYIDLGIGEVDLSIGFDYRSEDCYQRFPLWLLYFFPPDSSKDDIQQKINEFNERRFAKTRFCSLIARHDFNGIRGEIYHALTSIDRVDSAGSFLHNDDTLITKFADNKLDYLSRYRFNICPENSLKEGYVTEKLFESLWAGCIPIYWGPACPEERVLNPDWLIRWEIGGENEQAIARIAELNGNPAAYEKQADRPKFTPGAVDAVWDTFQGLRRQFERILE